MATWRNGYAEDCKSLYPGSIPGVASKKNLVLVIKKSKLAFLHSSVAQLVEQLTVNQLVAGSSPARGAKKRNSFKKISKGSDKLFFKLLLKYLILIFVKIY
jgi:hypothetical protein